MDKVGTWVVVLKFPLSFNVKQLCSCCSIKVLRNPTALSKYNNNHFSILENLFIRFVLAYSFLFNQFWIKNEIKTIQ